MRKELNIQIEQTARVEIANAYDWYEVQKTGLGETFLKALQKAFLMIQKAPTGYPQFRHHRKYTLKQFPFVILYEIQHDTLFIDAVFHTSRNPNEKIR